MLLTEQEARLRLKSEDNLANRFSNGKAINIIPFDVGNRGKEVPQFIKNTAALLAHGDDRQVDIAKEFGIPQPSVSGYKNGKHGVDGSALESSLEQVRAKAIERLMTSLGLITNEKLEKTSARDLSTISANMSKVVEKTLPRNEQGTNIQLNIYAPEQRREDRYKMIEV